LNVTALFNPQTDAAYGQLTNTPTPTVMQLALRFSF
jgi:hypothetical protein